MPARVLIVDDDPAMLRLLERRIRSAGYDVITASDGEEAIRIALVEKPPVIVTDWVMPNMDGLEFCRAMRTLEGFGFVYIIIITSHSEEDRVVEAFEAGADDFLHKPLRQQELLARLKAAMRIVQLEDDLDCQNRSIRMANAELVKLNARLEELARTDPLTQLGNRREALAVLGTLWQNTLTAGRDLSCIMIDIDHFKQLNDRYGHDFGDRALCEAARRIRGCLNGPDSVFRIGGEEFLLISPNRSAESAARLAEELCREVRSAAIAWNGIETKVTISLGVAQRDRMTATPDDLLKHADEALYAAKQAGRNQVRLAGQTAGMAFSANVFGAESAPAATLAKVLLVDDDPSIRVLCRRLLERAGYNVIEAQDGIEALSKVAQEKPEVIVLDALMPRLDGIGCVRKLKADPCTRDIPVIMASSLGDEQNIVAALEAGVDEYIIKPIRRKEFVLRVQSMARLYRGKLELSNAWHIRDEQANALAMLLDYSAALCVSQTLPTVLEKTVAITARLLRCNRVSIMLPEDSGMLTVAKAIGIEPHLAARIRVPQGGHIAGRVFVEKEPIIINAPGESQPGDNYDSEFFASMPLISHPLIGPEHAIGVLNVTEREHDLPFQPRELKYLQLISSIAAATIDDFVTRRARDEARDSIVGALATLAEYRDTDTGRHLDRVTQFSLSLARELRGQAAFQEAISDEFLHDLERAVPLHDIGKVAIPDSILLKPGRLTPDEMRQMKRHPQIGAQAIRSVIRRAPSVRFLKMAEEIAAGHHEWFDGTGYPQELKGDAIPLSARITALADVYDALTTKRVYKDAFSHITAMEIIRSRSGSQFAPEVVKAFEAREDEFRRIAAQLADAAPESESPAEEPAACAVGS